MSCSQDVRYLIHQSRRRKVFFWKKTIMSIEPPSYEDINNNDAYRVSHPDQTRFEGGFSKTWICMTLLNSTHSNIHTQAIPLIVQIHQHSPDNIIFEDHHHHHHHQLIISTPPPSNRPLSNLLHKDAILLPTTSTYEEVFNQLYQRVLARSAGGIPTAVAAGAALNERRLFCRLALLVDTVDVDNQQQQQILIDQGNWIAARTFLRFREHVELVFHFCFVPSTFHGGGGGGGQGWLMQYIRRRWRRRWRWGLGMAGRICLVEPSFDVNQLGWWIEEVVSYSMRMSLCSDFLFLSLTLLWGCGFFFRCSDSRSNRLVAGNSIASSDTHPLKSVSVQIAAIEDMVYIDLQSKSSRD